MCLLDQELIDLYSINSDQPRVSMFFQMNFDNDFPHNNIEMLCGLFHHCQEFTLATMNACANHGTPFMEQEEKRTPLPFFKDETSCSWKRCLYHMDFEWYSVSSRLKILLFINVNNIHSPLTKVIHIYTSLLASFGLLKIPRKSHSDSKAILFRVLIFPWNFSS